MKTLPDILLLVGSARKPHSNSEMILAYLRDRLHEHGCETEMLHIDRALNEPEQLPQLFKKIQQTAITLIASPLYMDTFPAQVIEFFEKTYTYRQQHAASRMNAFGVILNCGYPEASHNDLAVGMAYEFAQAAKLEWLGALTLGGGDILHTRPISKNSGYLRHITRALDLTALALKEKKPFPEEAVRMIRTTPVPRWLYHLNSNREWKKLSREYHTHKQLNNQPFKKPKS